MSEVEKKSAGRPPAQKSEGDLLDQRLKTLELQIRTLGERAEPREVALEKASEIISSISQARRSGGKNHWRVYNTRYKTPGGEPITFDFWSDAAKPEQARADYNERNGRSWSIDEGQDPLKFELVAE